MKKSGIKEIIDLIGVFFYLLIGFSFVAVYLFCSLVCYLIKVLNYICFKIKYCNYYKKLVRDKAYIMMHRTTREIRVVKKGKWLKVVREVEIQSQNSNPEDGKKVVKWIEDTFNKYKKYPDYRVELFFDGYVEEIRL